MTPSEGRLGTLPTFASGDEVVLIILDDFGETQVRDGTRVSMAGQGHCFGRL